MTNSSEHPITLVPPDAELQLETARKERIAAETELENARKSHAEIADRLRASNQRRHELDAFRNSKVKFHASMSDVFTLLRSEAEEYHCDETGTITVVLDGKPQSLPDALVALAVKNPTLADGRSLPRTERLRSEKRLSKADLLTPAAKAKFIAEHGLAAFQALPLRSVDTSTVTNAEEWKRLSVSEKTRFIAEHGEEAVARILHGQPSRTGSFINRSALERQSQIRGRQNR